MGLVKKLAGTGLAAVGCYWVHCESIVSCPVEALAPHDVQLQEGAYRGKVIVVGGGATGLAQALALAQRGLTVEVVEANQQLCGGASRACFTFHPFPAASAAASDAPGITDHTVPLGSLWNPFATPDPFDERHAVPVTNFAQPSYYEFALLSAYTRARSALAIPPALAARKLAVDELLQQAPAAFEAASAAADRISGAPPEAAHLRNAVHRLPVRVKRGGVAGEPGDFEATAGDALCVVSARVAGECLEGALRGTGRVSVRKGAPVAKLVRNPSQGDAGSPRYAVELDSGEQLFADAIVLCAGQASIALARDLHALPAFALRVNHMRLGPDDVPTSLISAGCYDDEAVGCRSLATGDQLLVTGTGEFRPPGAVNTWAPGGSPSMERFFREFVKRRFSPDERSVAKLEPTDLAVAADGLPVVGRLAGNVFISACHGHSVWPLAFATAPLLADYIAGGDTSSPALAALSPARFGGPGPIRALKQLFDRTAP